MASTLQLSRDPRQGRSVCSGSGIQSASGLDMASCCSRQAQPMLGEMCLLDLRWGWGKARDRLERGSLTGCEASQGRLWALAEAVGGRAERALHGWTWWVQLGDRSTKRK